MGRSRIKHTVKGICLEIFRQIRVAFPGDPDFGKCEIKILILARQLIALSALILA
jgi:hypothetical protein